MAGTWAPGIFPPAPARCQRRHGHHLVFMSQTCVSGPRAPVSLPAPSLWPPFCPHSTDVWGPSAPGLEGVTADKFSPVLPSVPSHPRPGVPHIPTSDPDFSPRRSSALFLQGLRQTLPSPPWLSWLFPQVGPLQLLPDPSRPHSCSGVTRADPSPRAPPTQVRVHTQTPVACAPATGSGSVLTCLEKTVFPGC